MTVFANLVVQPYDPLEMVAAPRCSRRAGALARHRRARPRRASRAPCTASAHSLPIAVSWSRRRRGDRLAARRDRRLRRRPDRCGDHAAGRRDAVLPADAARHGRRRLARARASAMRPSPWCIVWWPVYARLMRAQVLAVQRARACRGGDRRRRQAAPRPVHAHPAALLDPGARSARPWISARSCCSPRRSASSASAPRRRRPNGAR